MIFLFALRSLLSQRWAALNEVSAAVAAAIGTGALDCQLSRQLYGRAVHPSDSPDGVDQQQLY